MEQWRIDYNAAMGAARAAQAAGDFNSAINYTNTAAGLGNTSASATAAVNLRQDIYMQAGPGHGPGADPNLYAQPAPSGGGGGGNSPTPSPTVTIPPAAFSASQILENLLFAATGIKGLGPWAADLRNRGASPTEIVQSLRYGTDTSDAGKNAYAAYLAAFPRMDQFMKDGIFAGESPELQYIAYRNQVKEAAQRYGVDPSLVTSEKIADYIGGRNSPAEIVARMNTAATAIATTPVETYRQLEDYYGITGKDLMSFYLNTDETEADLQKRYTAARIGTEAARSDFGIDRNFAENLAQRGVGLDEATKGFGTAATQRGFQYGRGDTVNQDSLINAQFGGAMDAAAVARAAAARRNRFDGGGGYVTEQAGVSGLGSAGR